MGHISPDGLRGNIGGWTTVLRAERGLTRRALADRPNLSHALLTRVEAGVTPASPELMHACARALGTTRSLFDNDRRGGDGGRLLTLAFRAPSRLEVAM